MVGFYICVAIFIGLIAIGGYESTMRLVHYADLSVRYAIIQVRMYFMRKKLEKQLGIIRRENEHV
jgi:hypothetical protein